MSDRPWWWHWIADNLPRNVFFRIWVVFAILFLDRKGIKEAFSYLSRMRKEDKKPCD